MKEAAHELEEAVWWRLELFSKDVLAGARKVLANAGWIALGGAVELELRCAARLFCAETSLCGPAAAVRW